MRNTCLNILSASANATTNGSAVPANQIVSASFQFYASSSTAAGTVKIQASNDFSPSGTQMPSAFTPTNWVDIPSQSASITSGASALLTIGSMCYQWIRAVYTDTASGVQRVTAVADVSGSLNNKYFLLNSANNTHKYYVWLNVNSAGTDPMIAGRTGIEVDAATNDTADTIGAAMATAIAAAGSSADFTAANSSGAVTITNKIAGPYTAALDGAVPTGFTFSGITTPTGTINVEMNSLSV